MDGALSVISLSGRALTLVMDDRPKSHKGLHLSRACPSWA